MIDIQETLTKSSPTPSGVTKDETTLKYTLCLQFKTVHEKNVTNSTSTLKKKGQTIISLNVTD